MADKKYEMDMCNGPILGKILIFTLPLIASGILQLLFNAADMVVAGRFAGSVALAAVGATSSLINLLINVFLGLSVGSNVVIAHFYGAKMDKEVSETVHTSVMLALIGGVFLCIVGLLAASPLLRLMGTPEEILPHSVAYMRIYFIGMPVMLLYNFGAAILRAVGDTRRPLYYLTFAGVINVILNVIFVVFFKMGVKGVAFATIISQAVSALLVLRVLAVSESVIKLELSKLSVNKDKLLRIAKIGLPAGFQGSLFSISNVLIQSSVNSFGAIAVAGNTAAMNLEGFVYNSMNAFHQTAISFTGQNMGARKHDRVKKILVSCLGCVLVTGIVMGLLSYVFGERLLSMYSKDAEVIDYGLKRMAVIMLTYYLCGIMDVMVGTLRGMGYSIMPMIVSLMGACVFRIIWIFTVFRLIHTPKCLYISYPISWGLTFSVHLICFIFVARRRLNDRA
ncbi:MAG: MATE family efflux transporter [Lachnospiraceae bacterium]|nr:MATE family efflux transporter [Lachnospiraceae bacterium]